MRLSAQAITTALALLTTACDKKADGDDPTSSTVTVAPGAVARVTVGEHGFTPASLTISKGPAGSTAQVTFVRTSDQTCAKEVAFPELALKKQLPLDTPVTVDVPVDAARTLTFQCGMAMYKGAILVK